ncbi:DUF2652 domain-containing protein [Cyclobacterium marinum]|uniref:DUF2652 domain-containing protein n=1 Tax=Cyclobacterium marinum (strain ATCC 25205 / DSM 745 / LMG 13164 / NCIMB 1802) TaxID=880070 RepID=G0IYZ8_CYCMS|nr:DUF2652 domain-containing protein [Cyclobacterium marinum]AEL28143.1 hypothetical protein Cycma_4441 [Cyclobacterium marinum DSM 745]
MYAFSPVTNSSKGIIFIPDISGFTQFIKKTEIIHSQHIITELIELIIKETGDEFSVSEIEGDAVLFFNNNSLPDFEKLTSLCITIFKKFHQHLKYYARDRICHCGACNSTEKLSLKFILHSGTITQFEVGGHQKLLGEDVIVAHRFLKNRIDQSEYILFSGDFINDSKPSSHHLNSLIIGEENLEGLDNKMYYYRSLGPFKKEIEEPPARKSLNFPTIKTGKMVDISAQPKELLQMLTEPEHRIKWMKSLNRITLKDQKINRILSYHECVLGGNHLEVSIEDVVTNDVGIKFFERAQMKRPLLDFMVFYHMEKKDSKITQVGIGNHFFKSKYWIINRILLPILPLVFRFLNQINLRRLKEYTEKEYRNIL